MNSEFGKQQRPFYEWIVVLVIVCLVGVAIGLKCHYNEKNVQEEAIIHELKAMRTAVSLYIVTNKRPPERLSELTASTITINGDERPYLNKILFSQDHEFIDPFGNEYHYNPKTGWVNSSTPNYQDW